MAIDNVIITVSSPDRPGIIQAVSHAVLSSSGNWAESSFSILADVFVGIVRIEVDVENLAKLKQSLDELADHNITVNYAPKGPANTASATTTFLITLEANDREGIIEEITSMLAKHSVNIAHLDTRCESASMAGYSLFCADIEVSLPAGFTQQQLQSALEEVSDDVMVSVSKIPSNDRIKN